jgi:hypothetical protein
MIAGQPSTLEVAGLRAQQEPEAASCEYAFQLSFGAISSGKKIHQIKVIIGPLNDD